MSKPKAIVIGAGVGGLATAGLLAKAGWDVQVFESRDMAGGRAGLLKKDGFTFDTGPSWYLMPEVFEHYFNLVGKKTTDYFELVRLDPAYKVFYDYRKPITIYGDRSRDLKNLEKIEPGAERALTTYLQRAELTYELAKKYFLYNPFSSSTSLARAEVLKRSATLAKLLALPLQRYVEQTVQSLPLQQILQYPAVFLGTSPFNAPAMYHLMSHLDFEQGVYYPQGGLYELVKAMLAINEELGVQVHYKSPVDKIITKNGTAIGVHLQNGEQHEADIVISNADLHFTETKLLPPGLQTYPETYWQKKTAGPSALLMYLGIKGELPQLTHHNLLFMKEWRKNFERIFKDKVWPDKPSVYICKPSETDPSVAPKGSENVFVLVPLPAGSFKDKKFTEQYADQCLDMIADICNIPDLNERIITKTLYGPNDFAEQLNAWEGTALGMAHVLSQSAFFRPGNRSRKVRNLYYVGGNSQPGIGLPMCLIGAEVVYKHLIGDKTAGPLPELKAPKGGWHVAA